MQAFVVRELPVRAAFMLRCFGPGFRRAVEVAVRQGLPVASQEVMLGRVIETIAYLADLDGGEKAFIAARLTAAGENNPFRSFRPERLEALREALQGTALRGTPEGCQAFAALAEEYFQLALDPTRKRRLGQVRRSLREIVFAREVHVAPKPIVTLHDSFLDYWRTLNQVRGRASGQQPSSSRNARQSSSDPEASTSLLSELVWNVACEDRIQWPLVDQRLWPSSSPPSTPPETSRHSNSCPKTLPRWLGRAIA